MSLTSLFIPVFQYLWCKVVVDPEKRKHLFSFFHNFKIYRFV